MVFKNFASRCALHERWDGWRGGPGQKKEAFASKVSRLFCLYSVVLVKSYKTRNRALLPESADRNLLILTAVLSLRRLLMTNHFHLLIERQAGTIGKITQRVLTGYSQHYNRKYRRVRQVSRAGTKLSSLTRTNILESFFAISTSIRCWRRRSEKPKGIHITAKEHRRRGPKNCVALAEKLVEY